MGLKQILINKMLSFVYQCHPDLKRDSVKKILAGQRYPADIATDVSLELLLAKDSITIKDVRLAVEHHPPSAKFVDYLSSIDWVCELMKFQQEGKSDLQTIRDKYKSDPNFPIYYKSLVVRERFAKKKNKLKQTASNVRQLLDLLSQIK